MQSGRPQADDEALQLRRLLEQVDTWTSPEMRVTRVHVAGEAEHGRIRAEAPLRVVLGDDELAYRNADALLADGWRFEGFH